MSSLWTPGGEHPVEPERHGADGAEGPDDLGPEDQARVAEELAAMQAEVASTPASVVVANHAIGLFQLAVIHLNQRPPHLEEGRLAIDAMAALVEGIAGRLGDGEQSLRDGLAQLRLAFVQLQSAGNDGTADETADGR